MLDGEPRRPLLGGRRRDDARVRVHELVEDRLRRRGEEPLEGAKAGEPLAVDERDDSGAVVAVPAHVLEDLTGGGPRPCDRDVPGGVLRSRTELGRTLRIELRHRRTSAFGSSQDAPDQVFPAEPKGP